MRHLSQLNGPYMGHKVENLILSWKTKKKKSLKEYLCSYLQADIWREIMVTGLFIRYGLFLLFFFTFKKKKICVRNEVLEWTTNGS